jgi:hypothetical protein
MANEKAQDETKLPPNPNPNHPGNPKTAEQMQADQKALAERDEQFKKEQQEKSRRG